MNVQEPDEDRPIAWTAILQHTPAYAEDGVEVGTVKEVLGAEDIFHGLVVAQGPGRHDIEIPATHVTRITTKRIEVDLTAQEIRDLLPVNEEEAYRLGFTGLFHRLGWVRDTEKPGND